MSSPLCEPLCLGNVSTSPPASAFMSAWISLLSGSTSCSRRFPAAVPVRLRHQQEWVDAIEPDLCSSALCSMILTRLTVNATQNANEVACKVACFAHSTVIICGITLLNVMYIVWLLNWITTRSEITHEACSYKHLMEVSMSKSTKGNWSHTLRINSKMKEIYPSGDFLAIYWASFICIGRNPFVSR